MKNTERFFHQRLTLSEGAAVRNTIDFPLNKLITAIYLRVRATVTVGGSPTSYVAADNPILQLIQNIQFKVSGDGLAINAPALALYHLAAMKAGKLPRIDNASFNPNSGAAYAMSASIPLYFADPLMARPEDTLLDMSRYSSAELWVLMGAGTNTVKAGVGSGGTFTISAAECDIVIESIAGAPRDTMRPIFFPKVEVEGAPKNVASETQAKLTRATDRLLKRVIFSGTNGAAISRPFSGAGSALIVDQVSFGDERQYYDRQRYQADLADEFQVAYKVDAQTGLYVLDYTKDKSNLSAIPTGDKGDLRLEYTVGASAPATLTNAVSVVSETLNQLKAV